MHMAMMAVPMGMTMMMVVVIMMMSLVSRVIVAGCFLVGRRAVCMGVHMFGRFTHRVVLIGTGKKICGQYRVSWSSFHHFYCF